MASLENCVDFDRERLSASAAFIDTDPSAFALELDAIIYNAAMRTDAPLFPNNRFYPVISRLFIVEPGVI